MRSIPLLLAATLTASVLSAQAPRHPLDGLSGSEHWAAYDAIRSHWKTDSTTRYAYMGLQEPPKAEVLAWRPGQPFRREDLAKKTVRRSIQGSAIQYASIRHDVTMTAGTLLNGESETFRGRHPTHTGNRAVFQRMTASFLKLV